MNGFKIALTQISHHTPVKSVSYTGFCMIIMIQVSQFLSLLLTDNSDELIQYDEHAFLKLKHICGAFLLRIDELQDTMLYGVIVTNLFTLLVFCHMTIFQQANLYDYRISYIYTYWILLQKVLLLPQLSILFKTISLANPILVYISIIILVLILLQTMCSLYFIRRSKVDERNSIIRRHSLIDFIPILLNGLSIYVYYQPSSSTLMYFKLTALAVSTAIETLHTYFYSPYNYQENQLAFSIACVKLQNALLVIYVLVSYQNYFPNGFYIVNQLICGTFTFALAQKIFQLKSVRDMSKQYGKLQHYMQIQMLQELMYLNAIGNLQPQTINAIKYAHILVYHQRFCCKPNCQVCFATIYKSGTFKVTNLHLIGCILDSLMSHDDNEVNSLMKIDYLVSFCKQPRLALLELRKFQLRSTSLSLYYKLKSQEIYQSLTTQIEQTSEPTTHYIYSDDSNSITSGQIIKFMKIEKHIIQSVIQIIEKKIQLLRQQIIGYETLYEFKDQLIQLAKHIQQFTEQFNEQTGVDLSIKKLQVAKVDTLMLKLISIYYSVVMNNYHQSLICQSQLEQIMRYESVLSQSSLTALATFDSKVQAIQVSLLKNLGQILNLNKLEILEFFDYNQEDQQHIMKVNSFMPKYLAQIHDQILLNFLQTGQSIMLSHFRTVFGLNKYGFIFPLQIKLHNNFMVTQDYVMLGFLFKTNPNIDYIIFDESGRIDGISQDLWQQIIVDNDVTLSLEYLLSQCYVFLLMPQILKCIRQLAGMKYDAISESQWIEDDLYLTVRQDLHTFISDFNQQVTRLITNCKGISKGSASVSQYEAAAINQDMDYSRVHSHQTEKLSGELQTLADETLQTTVQDYFVQKHDSQVIQYKTRIRLSLQQISRQSTTKSYFQLEIHDIRKVDNKASSIGSNYFKSQASQYQSVQNNASNNYSQQISISIEMEEALQVDHHYINQSSYKAKQQNNASFYINKYDPYRKENMNDQNFEISVVNGESFKNSMSCGPLSQRANFISPSNKHIYNEELEMMELELQFNSARGDISKQMLSPDQLSVDQDLSRRNEPINSISLNNKQNQSNQILKVIIQHKRGEQEADAVQSRSSINSKTSGASATEFVRQFQNANLRLSYVVGIILINCLVLGGLFMIMTLHLWQLNVQYSTIIENSKQLIGPLKFNRQFTNTMALSWILTCQEFSVLNSSEFMQRRIITDLITNRESTFTNMTELYPVFVDIEQKGLLTGITVSDIRYPAELVSYTKFASIMQTNCYILLQVNYQNTNFTRNSNTMYLDALLFLRYNIKNVKIMNQELMTSLIGLFDDSVSNLESLMLTQIFIEATLISVLIAIQLQFWKRIEKHNQLLIFLLGKLSEFDAQCSIKQLNYIKLILSTSTGPKTWKLKDFYQICFIEQHGHDNEKLIKNEKQVKSQQSLSNRINTTNTNIYVHAAIVIITILVIFMYVFGGYLLNSNQQSQVEPIEKLSHGFMNFSSQVDLLITISLIIKTQPLLYPILVNYKFYQTDMFDLMHQQDQLLQMFNELQMEYTQNVIQLLQNIVKSDIIKSDDLNKLITLYQGSWCDSIQNQIAFCEFDTIPYSTFISKYGVFVEQDDNTQYLSKGIIGIVSLMQSLFQENYDYELIHQSYHTDLAKMNTLIQTKLFNNIILSHFTDTALGMNEFLDTIDNSVFNIKYQQLVNIIVYFSVLGILLMIIYGITYFCWIRKALQDMRNLRFTLILLPIEIVMSIQTIQLLKRLE